MFVGMKKNIVFILLLCVIFLTWCTKQSNESIETSEPISPVDSQLYYEDETSLWDVVKKTTQEEVNETKDDIIELSNDIIESVRD